MIKKCIHHAVFYFTIPLIILFIAVLFFGNPQWHKAIYMFLWQVLGAQTNEVGELAVPGDYDGLWRQWNADGELTAEIYYVEGPNNKWAYSQSYITYHPEPAGWSLIEEKFRKQKRELVDEMNKATDPEKREAIRESIIDLANVREQLNW